VLAATTLIALGGVKVSVIAPIDVDLQHEPVHTVDDLVIIEDDLVIIEDDLVIIEDDLVIIEDPTDTVTAAVAATPLVQREPVMFFVYLGMLSLLAIVATAAYLAF
jgi:hypothetical protein